MWIFVLSLMCMGVTRVIEAQTPLQPVVETEYPVYDCGNPNNGAGPMWCYGSTCLVRWGQEVFASGIEVIPEQKPLNNVRWTLWRLGAQSAELLQKDPTGRQREPCPLGVFSDGRLLLTSNPTLTAPEDYNGPAQPQLLLFKAQQPTAPPRVLLPRWEGAPAFTEHSYRGFAVDSSRNEALYWQNVGYNRAYWSFLNRTGEWSHCGVVKMPWGAEFEKPEPIRICYQQIALCERAVHVLGVSDIIEWVREWREFKRTLPGRTAWDYDFRRLYYCWTPDLTRQPFSEWIKIADCDRTCGHITNLDLWLDTQGRAHILWIEQSVWDTRVRDKFFPQEPQTFALMYGIIEQGRLVHKTRLAFGGEKQESQEIPGWARFQATPEGRLFVFYYMRGKNAAGEPVNENRIREIFADGRLGEPVRVPLQHPLTTFFTACERGGSLPSEMLDVLGHASGIPGLGYARIRLQRSASPTKP